MDASIERITGGPEVVVLAAEARDGSVRPDRPRMTLDELLTYYRGALSAAGVLSGRFGGRGRSGPQAFGEGGGDGAVLRGHPGALGGTAGPARETGGRKSTRLTFRHANISYGVILFKKKKEKA